MNLKRIAVIYQVLAGACDSITGLLLLTIPLRTLDLMHVTQSPRPIVFMSYIGVFVLGVGLSYFWTLWRTPLSAATVLAWKTQWQITALIRLLVAAFVFTQVVAGSLQGAWAMVGVSDALLATVQIVGLYGGWLERAS